MDMLISGDGVRLHLRHWPAHGAPAQARGLVQLVHGLGEHIARYEALAEVLNAAGWHVAGHDHRGHGRSEGPRGVLPQNQQLLVDLASVMDHLRSQVGGGPRPGWRHVLLGHSMGGAVAARFVAEGLVAQPARWSRAVDGLVLSSPALAADLSAWQRLQLAVLPRLVPDVAAANGLDPAWISRDPEVVAAYKADPLVHDRITGRLARFILDAGEQVRGLAPRWRTPTLLLWGGADRCVAPWGSAAFAGAAPAAVVEAHVHPALVHEIFNEPEREQVFAQLTAWLQRLAPS
ncbi:MAG: lysophospholipase [Rubrivivax sp.]|nr:lysophospholipase [Rubrivivax sp.]